MIINCRWSLDRCLGVFHGLDGGYAAEFTENTLEYAAIRSLGLVGSRLVNTYSLLTTRNVPADCIVINSSLNGGFGEAQEAPR